MIRSHPTHASRLYNLSVEVPTKVLLWTVLIAVKGPFVLQGRFLRVAYWTFSPLWFLLAWKVFYWTEAILVFYRSVYYKHTERYSCPSTWSISIGPLYVVDKIQCCSIFLQTAAQTDESHIWVDNNGLPITAIYTDTLQLLFLIT